MGDRAEKSARSLMPTLQKSTRARIDLLGIWDYVTRDTGLPDRADHVLDRIEEVCQVLSEYPKAGEKRPELGQSLRTFPADSFVIVYRPVGDGVEIVRVFHESRDLPAQF